MSRDIAQIHKLKEDILAGNTTYSDVERRLSAAIEAEYDREDANIDFINACEDLLLEMHTDGELPSFPTSEEYAIEMQKHMLVKKERSFLPKLAWRCAAVLAAMLVIALLGDQVFHWQWFSGTSTEDEQQYVIQGHKVTVPMITESIAEHEGEMLQTDKREEVIDFLGFTPPTLSSSALAIEKEQYVVMVDSEGITLSARYFDSVDDGSPLLLKVQYCSALENAYMLFEQDAEGEKINIHSQDVYVAMNLDRVSFTWMDDTSVYRIAGDIDQRIGELIVSDIIGGKK